MAKCPSCRYSFRTMDDEEGMHDCPRCGYDGHGPEILFECHYCDMACIDGEFAPYCGPQCALEAELESGEDSQ